MQALPFLSLSFATRVLTAPSWNLCFIQYCIRSNPDSSPFYCIFLTGEVGVLTFLQFSFIVILKGIRKLDDFWLFFTAFCSKDTLHGISKARPAKKLLKTNSLLIFSFRWQSFVFLKLRNGYRILIFFIFSLLLCLMSFSHSPLFTS
jgi:hypothetical protein